MKKLIMVVLLLLTMSACTAEDKTIKVGASSTPHALILEQTRAYIESKGYKLQIVVFDDYVLPNLSLENNELDANYFQHVPYLNDFNENNGTHIKAYYKVHFEPMGIYSGTKNDLADYRPGDKIVVPSDKSNYDRAIELLNVLGITRANIIMMEAQNIPMALRDCAFAVVNGNYALASEITHKCLATESKDSAIAQRLANIIAIKTESDKTKLLVEALKQPNIEQYIKDQFKGSVVYVGADA